MGKQKMKRKTLICWCAIVTGIVILTAGIAVGIYFILENDDTEDTEGYKTIDWKAPADNRTPPVPIFNPDDNAECRQIINEWYESADRKQKKIVRVEQGLNEVLDRQAKYGIEIVNNPEFNEAWAVNRDEDGPYNFHTSRSEWEWY